MLLLLAGYDAIVWRKPSKFVGANAQASLENV
jgi:hypothetical protein